MEKMRKNEGICMDFLDFEKAFDSVAISEIVWEALQKKMYCFKTKKGVWLRIIRVRLCYHR